MYASNYMHTSSASPEMTSKAILDAAADVFGQKGYAGATTRAIAIKAHLNEVTLFRHFGNKKKLFQAVIDRSTDIGPALEKMPAPEPKDPDESLVRIGMYLSQQMGSRARVSKLVLIEGQRAGIKNVLERLPLKGIGHLRGVFEAMGAKDPYMCSVAFISFILRSVMFKEFLGQDPCVELSQENMRRFVKILVRGMR